MPPSPVSYEGVPTGVWMLSATDQFGALERSRGRVGRSSAGEGINQHDVSLSTRRHPHVSITPPANR